MKRVIIERGGSLRMRKTVSAILLVTFLSYSAGFAAVDKGLSAREEPGATVTLTTDYNIVISKDIGSIKTRRNGKNGKLVIHIQDAHCNYEAQQNIARILEHLVKQYGINFVAVEGADGIVDTSWFKAFPDTEIRKEVADYFMKKGEITGAEFLSITSDYPFTIYGAEDRKYYVKNLNSFLESYPYKDEFRKYYTDVKGALAKLKKYIYTKELAALDTKVNSHKAKEIKFADYAAYLNNTAKSKKINIKDYENFRTLTETLRYEKDINFDTVNEERARLIDELSKIMSKEELSKLVNKSLEFKLGKIEGNEFYTYLAKLAKENNISLSGKYNNLVRYIMYSRIYSRIDNEKLFDEIDILVKALKEKMFINEPQRILDTLWTNVNIILGFMDIELTNKEYEYYLANKEGFSPEKFSDFIKQSSSRFGLSCDINETPPELNYIFPKLVDFYDIATKRDEILINNMFKGMRGKKTDAAVLITGGFHTKGIEKILEEKDASYVVLSPAITKETESPYISVLTGQKTPFEELLVEAEKKNLLAPPSRLNRVCDDLRIKRFKTKTPAGQAEKFRKEFAEHLVRSYIMQYSGTSKNRLRINLNKVWKKHSPRGRREFYKFVDEFITHNFDTIYDLLIPRENALPAGFDNGEWSAISGGIPTDWENQTIPSSEEYYDTPSMDDYRDMFRDYDYRKTDGEIEHSMAFRLGLTWAKMALDRAEVLKTENRKVVVSRDTREIDLGIVKALIKALRYAGLTVIYTSEKPDCTSSYSWATIKYNPLMSIMITSSHVVDPERKGISGFKVSIKNENHELQSLTTREIKQTSREIIETFIKNPKEIEKLGEGTEIGSLLTDDVTHETIRFNTAIGRIASSKQKNVNIYEMARDFEADANKDKALEVLERWEQEAGKAEPLKGMKVVIEASHAPSGYLAEATLKNLGAETILLHGDVRPLNGEHKADPAKEKNLVDLKETMEKEHADFGLAFDLDGDRGAIVIPTREGKHKTVAPDVTMVAILNFIVEKCGYKGKKLAVVRDVLATKAVEEMARAVKIKSEMTDSGYVFLKKMVQNLKNQGYTVPIYSERSGHAWLDVTGVFENPIVVFSLFAIMVNECRKDMDSPYPFEDAIARNKVRAYKQSTRFQPLYSESFKEALASHPGNVAGWRYEKNTKPPQAIIALGKDVAIKALSKFFTAGKSFVTPAGTLTVSEFLTYRDSEEDGGLFRYADIEFTINGKYAGRFIFRASSNDPTFVCSFETPVWKSETPDSKSVQLRYDFLGGLVLDWLEKRKYARVAGEGFDYANKDDAESALKRYRDAAARFDTPTLRNVLEEVKKYSGLPIYTNVAQTQTMDLAPFQIWSEAFSTVKFDADIYRRVERVDVKDEEGNVIKRQEQTTGEPAFTDVHDDTDIDSFKVYDKNGYPGIIRTGERMQQVLMNPEAQVTPEAYFMYRGPFRSRNDIQKAFYDNKVRYDITIIPPAEWGRETSKTFGHYHSPVEMPETYQVLSGEAIYFMQKEKKNEKGEVVGIEDAVMVRAKAGDIVIMLPGYGHVSINTSQTEPLIMANWLTWHQTSYYGSFENNKGAVAYAMRNDEGNVTMVPNANYSEVVVPRQMSPRNSIPAFGLVRGRSIYELVESADFGKFVEFLTKPGDYANELTPEATLQPVEEHERIPLVGFNTLRRIREVEKTTPKFEIPLEETGESKREFTGIAEGFVIEKYDIKMGNRLSSEPLALGRPQTLFVKEGEIALLDEKGEEIARAAKGEFIEAPLGKYEVEGAATSVVYLEYEPGTGESQVVSGFEAMSALLAQESFASAKPVIVHEPITMHANNSFIYSKNLFSSKSNNTVQLNQYGRTIDDLIKLAGEKFDSAFEHVFAIYTDDLERIRGDKALQDKLQNILTRKIVPIKRPIDETKGVSNAIEIETAAVVLGLTDLESIKGESLSGNALILQRIMSRLVGEDITPETLLALMGGAVSRIAERIDLMLKKLVPLTEEIRKEVRARRELLWSL